MATLNPELNEGENNARTYSRRKFLKLSALLGPTLTINRLFGIKTPDPATQRAVETVNPQPDIEVLDLSSMTQENAERYIRETLNPRLRSEMEANPEMMRPGVGYYSIIIARAEYENFPKITLQENTHRTFAEQMKLQNAELNKMLLDANNILPSYGMEQNIEGSVCRRIIVMPSNTAVDEIADSDGQYRIDAGYDPTICGYYDRTTGLDRGLNHEICHAIYFPDLYAEDIDWRNQNATAALRTRLMKSAGNSRITDVSTAEFIPGTIPTELQSLPANARWHWGDSPATYPDMMENEAPVFAHWTACFRSRLISLGLSHNREISSRMIGWSYPNEEGVDVAAENFIKVSTQFAGREVKIFRSTAPTVAKGLEEISHGRLGPDGTFPIGNPFVRPAEIPEDEYYVREGMPAYGSVLLVVAYDTQGRITNWQYVDITTFNLAAWMGYNGKAVVGFNLADANSLPPDQQNYGLKLSGEAKKIPPTPTPTPTAPPPTPTPNPTVTPTPPRQPDHKTYLPEVQR